MIDLGKKYEESKIFIIEIQLLDRKSRYLIDLLSEKDMLMYITYIFL